MKKEHKDHKATCKEHSCPRGRGKDGYCDRHQLKTNRHHEKKSTGQGVVYQARPSTVEVDPVAVAQLPPTQPHPRLPGRIKRGR